MCDVLDIAEQRGEARGAKAVIDLIRRLLKGEDEFAIRKSGVNDELLKMAVGVLQKQKTYKSSIVFYRCFLAYKAGLPRGMPCHIHIVLETV